MAYFKFTEKFEQGLEGLRGHFLTLEVDHSDGETEAHSGILCKSKRGRFMLSLGTIDEPEFVFFNVNRIKSMRIDGKTYTPKEN
jgi:hypothetical protein